MKKIFAIVLTLMVSFVFAACNTETTFVIEYVPDMHSAIGHIEGHTVTKGDEVVLSNQGFASVRKGYIQTGWTAGGKVYELGGKITPTADMRLFPF